MKILLVILVVIAAACSPQVQDGASVSVAAQSLTSSINVKKAITAEMPELLSSGELMRVDPDLASAIGVSVGHQVRVTRNSTGELALYTVSGFYEDSSNNDGRMALAGRQRVGTTDGFSGTIDSQVPHPTYTDQEAEDNSEFVERLDVGLGNFLVVLAPHGGHVEPGTDEESEAAGSILGDLATVWRCKGFKQGGGAHDKWHITSTDINPASFPLLDTIDEVGYVNAVSFHGMSGTKRVLIGGNGLAAVKLALQVAIEAALPASYAVDIATPLDENAGMSPENIVNWMTIGGIGGIQLEQTLDVRTNYGDEVATAVAGVFAALAPPEIDAGSPEEDAGESDAGSPDAGSDSGMCYCPCQ